ncbi:hypothetical protein Leryth_024789 [Lithospermum erythrorhizon]|nr:hypothetical protein Leryth_024789 [Lithospermum erythrorhizon]
MDYLKAVLGIQLFLFTQLLAIKAATHPNDFGVLQYLIPLWNGAPEPPNWVGNDPCGSNWVGIECNYSRVINIKLGAMGLTGQLAHEIGNLAELQILFTLVKLFIINQAEDLSDLLYWRTQLHIGYAIDLSFNKGLNGNLPSSVGNLTKLTSLLLVNCNFSGLIPDSISEFNKFSGQIPASIGLLSNLNWLDLADNELEHGIPVSDGKKPGLDMLIHTQHFHFGGNRLSGDIPATLFTSNMRLIHLLLENNQLSGSIPNTLGLVRSLKVVRLDNNSLSGSAPPNINELTEVTDLYLSNNRLNSSFLNLTGMDKLNIFPYYRIIDNAKFEGLIPAAFFSLPRLQTAKMSHNKLSGVLNISSPSNELQLVDLQGNEITEFPPRSLIDELVFMFCRLAQNPVCYESYNDNYCTIPKPPNNSYSTPVNCSSPTCNADQVSSPTCNCAYPFTGVIAFRAPSYLESTKRYAQLEQNMLQWFHSYGLPVDSVALSNPRKNIANYLEINVQIFPFDQPYFNQSGAILVGYVLSRQIYKPPDDYGPYIFSSIGYKYTNGNSSPTPTESSDRSFVIGVAVSSSLLAILLLVAGVHIFRQKRRAQMAATRSDPFASWAPNKDIGGVPKIKGVKSFSFEELKKYTDNFSEMNDIGTGGYGKVYRGALPNGQLAAIKRAQHGSMQGALEFKTEIELLSRVHHRNVVSLLGFCFEQGEQMLVYEYIPNGTLRDSLSGKSGIRLDWIRRLRIALGAARGLLYLHDLADPPIIHRDVKSNNILLDDQLNAKVADFGLSKLMGELHRSYVSTQVKGTMGYLDPEYFMTQQLTDKSDVFGFGVVLLELITARNPFEKGIYVVKAVRETMNKSKILYNLHSILDQGLASSMTTKSLERFVDLAMKCVEEEGVDRPTMSEVVKEIESIMESVGWNPTAGSASTSATSATPTTSASYESYPFSYETL